MQGSNVSVMTIEIYIGDVNIIIAVWWDNNYDNQQIPIGVTTMGIVDIRHVDKDSNNKNYNDT